MNEDFPIFPADVPTGLAAGLTAYARMFAPQQEKRLLSYAEAASVLGITVDALQKRVARKQLPRGSVVRSGKRVQFVADRLIPGG